MVVGWSFWLLIYLLSTLTVKNLWYVLIDRRSVYFSLSLSLSDSILSPSFLSLFSFLHSCRVHFLGFVCSFFIVSGCFCFTLQNMLQSISYVMMSVCYVVWLSSYAFSLTLLEQDLPHFVLW